MKMPNDLCEIKSWINTDEREALAKSKIDYRPKYSSDLQLMAYMPDEVSYKDFMLTRNVVDGKLILKDEGGWNERMKKVMRRLKFDIVRGQHPEENKSGACYLSAKADDILRQEIFVKGENVFIVLERWDIIFVNDPTDDSEVLIGALYFDEVDKNDSNRTRLAGTRQYKTTWRWRN